MTISVEVRVDEASVPLFFAILSDALGKDNVFYQGTHSCFNSMGKIIPDPGNSHGNEEGITLPSSEQECRAKAK